MPILETNILGSKIEIDYQKGYISRTPDNDERVMNPRRPLSIVLDAYKQIQLYYVLDKDVLNITDNITLIKNVNPLLEKR